VLRETNLLIQLSFYKNVNYKVAASRRMIASERFGQAEGKKVLPQYRGGSGICLFHIRFEDAGLLTMLYLEIS
jgi:hypothetical protein